MLSMLSTNGRIHTQRVPAVWRDIIARAIQYTPRATKTAVSTAVETMPGMLQCNAVPRRKPPPSAMPKQSANGTRAFRLITVPTARHAIKLSIPSSRKPISPSYRCLPRTVSGVRGV